MTCTYARINPFLISTSRHGFSSLLTADRDVKSVAPTWCSTSSMRLEYARGYPILRLVGLTVVRYRLGDFTDSGVSLRQLLSAACISS